MKKRFWAHAPQCAVLRRNAAKPHIFNAAHCRALRRIAPHYKFYPKIPQVSM